MAQAQRKKSSSSGRRYSPGASKKVERAMHEAKHGELRSGRSGRKVKNPKQAIAIGLSEARKAGEKVPPPPTGGASARKSTPRKSTLRKSTPRKPTPRKSARSKGAGRGAQGTSRSSGARKRTGGRRARS